MVTHCPSIKNISIMHDGETAYRESLLSTYVMSLRSINKDQNPSMINAKIKLARGGTRDILKAYAGPHEGNIDAILNQIFSSDE